MTIPEAYHKYRYIIYAILVVIILVVVYTSYKHKTQVDTIPWVPIPVEAIGNYGGLKWDISDVFEMYRPWSHPKTRAGNGLMEYLGVMEIKRGDILRLHVDMPAQQAPAYWEYDVYSYPTFKLAHCIPMTRTAYITDSGLKQPYGVDPGFYFVALRVAGGNRPITGGVTRTPTARASQPVQLPTINDTDKYTVVEDTYVSVEPVMDERGNTLLYTEQSKDLPLYPATPYVRREHMSLEVEPCKEVLLIYSSRDTASSMCVNINGENYFPVPTEGHPTGTAIYSIPHGGHMEVTELTYGISSTSDLLPFYAYIFDTQCT